MAELLDDLFAASRNPTVAYLASVGEVKVRVTAAPTAAEAEALIEPVVDAIVARLGDVVFSTTDEPLEAAVMRLLIDSKRTLSCAESLTGGGVAERLTVAPGASETFVGSAVVYTPDAKRAILGVREGRSRPGRHEACAREMAAGARRAFESDVAVALTGAAGPELHEGAARRYGSRSTRTACSTHAGSIRLANATRCAAGPSRPPSTSFDAISRPPPESDRVV